MSYNGVVTFDDKVETQLFSRASDICTETVTVVSGQVLKARSLVESNGVGKVTAHTGLAEKAVITFPTKVDTGETVIIAGLTFTAGSNATTTKAQLASAWANLPVGTTAAQANTLNASAISTEIGTFTAGTLTGYKTKTGETAGTVLFVSTTGGGVTDLTVTGTGDASSVSVTAVNSPVKLVKGALVFDVNASDGDVEASIYKEARFWNTALVWEANIATDTITLPDGTTKACTEYDTGTADNFILQKKLLEGSKIEIDAHKTGEVM